MKRLLLIVLILSVQIFSCSKYKYKGGNIKKIIYAGPGSTEEIQIMKKIFSLFEKENPDVKIEFIHTSWNEYWAKLETMLAAGTPPDIAYMGGGYLQSLAKKGALLNLENLMYKDTDLKKSDFFSESLKGAMYKGSLYGIPRDVGPFVLFYNKDMFDTYGVPYPEDWNWNKLIKYGKEFVKDLNRDGIIDQFAYDMPGGYEEYMRIIWSFGGTILNKRKTKVTMNEKGVKKALVILKNLISKYKISPFLTKRGGINFFETGRIAMHPDGYWMIAHYQKNLSFKFGVAPVIKGDKRVGFLSETTYSIPIASKNKKLAWKLLKFLVSDKVEKMYATSGLAIPAVKRVAYSEEVQSLPYMKVFVKSVEYSKCPPFTPYWNEMINIMQREMDKYFLGKISVDKLIKTCREKVNKLLSSERNK